MGINHINAVGGASERAYDFASKRAASADSGDTSEKRGENIDKEGIAKLVEMNITDSKTTEDFVSKMVERANKQLRGTNREFNYSIHEETGQFMVKVIDRETKEVIREIPPEKTLDAVARMWDLLGVFIDNKS